MDDVMGIDWDELRDRALAEWDDLTEEDLEVPEGDIGTLVERIQDRTGESAGGQSSHRGRRLRQSVDGLIRHRCLGDSAAQGSRIL
jgi:hypothetical protein